MGSLYISAVTDYLLIVPARIRALILERAPWITPLLLTVVALAIAALLKDSADGRATPSVFYTPEMLASILVGLMIAVGLKLLFATLIFAGGIGFRNSQIRFARSAGALFVLVALGYASIANGIILLSLRVHHILPMPSSYSLVPSLGSILYGWPMPRGLSEGRSMTNGYVWLSLVTPFTLWAAYVAVVILHGAFRRGALQTGVLTFLLLFFFVMGW